VRALSPAKGSKIAHTHILTPWPVPLRVTLRRPWRPPPRPPRARRALGYEWRESEGESGRARDARSLSVTPRSAPARPRIAHVAPAPRRPAPAACPGVERARICVAPALSRSLPLPPHSQTLTQGAGKGKRVGAPPGAALPPPAEAAGPSGQASEKVRERERDGREGGGRASEEREGADDRAHSRSTSRSTPIIHSPDRRPPPRHGHPGRLQVAGRRVLHRPRHRAPRSGRVRAVRRGRRVGRADGCRRVWPRRGRGRGRGQESRRVRTAGPGHPRHGVRVLCALPQIQPPHGRVGERGGDGPEHGGHDGRERGEWGWRGGRRGRRGGSGRPQAGRRRGRRRPRRRGPRRVRRARPAGARGVHESQERGAHRAGAVRNGDVVLQPAAARGGGRQKTLLCGV